MSSLDINPYEGHPSLSQLEAAVLWEYAKLAQNVGMVSLFIFHSYRGSHLQSLGYPENTLALRRTR